MQTLLTTSPPEKTKTAPRQWGSWLRFRSRSPVRHRAQFERILGTTLELQLIVGTREQGIAAEAAILQEIDRLEQVFSAYRPDSELRRWQQTHALPIPVSPELATVLQTAEDWRKRTDSAFHPAVESLTRLWRAASEQGIEPDCDLLAQTAREMQAPLWEVDRDAGIAIRRTTFPVTLNAVAKGFIVDQACQVVSEQPGVHAALINIGGDIRQIGGNGAPVAISDPFAPQDNATPLDTVRLRGQGIATSGNYRRGFQIGERWHSHILDPRTGYPVESVVSASVIAESAALADILTTAFSVLTREESLSLADTLPGVGVLLIAPSGERRSNTAWKQQTT